MLGLEFGLRPDLDFFQNALEDTAADVAIATALKRFKFLATKMSRRQNTDSQSAMLGRTGRPHNTMADNIRGQLARSLPC